MRTRSRVQDRVLDAAIFGGKVGLVYLGLGALLWTVRGHLLAELPAVTWFAVSAVFVLGGATAGGVVGAMEPSITSPYRAIAVFAFACVPLAVGINEVFFPSATLHYKNPIPRHVTLALFLGAVAGMVYWTRRQRTR